MSHPKRWWTSAHVLTALCGVALVAAAYAGMPSSSADVPVTGLARSAATATQPAAAPAGRWIAGDAHTHTWLSPDGAHTQAKVAEKAFSEFGLDWISATDHGGRSIHTATGRAISPPTWMWRTIGSLAYPAVLKQRARFPDKRILQGIEWHMPGHDHAGVALVSNAAAGLAQFDYRFDSTDRSTARPGWRKRNRTRTDSIRAAQWLSKHYAKTSYLIVNHPSRKLDITARDLRDLNNAAPTVAFGFEGLLGRHKQPSRGGYQYDFGSRTKYARPYGGADYFVAKIGGVWDSLLGEGRKFYAFADSDFHDPSTDFWPGEYEKTYTWVKGASYADIVNGLRSGNSFSVTGGIIDRLSFRASNRAGSATMGQTVTVQPGSDVTVTVSFRVPSTRTGPGTPQVDHIDLIRGLTHTKAKPGTKAYRSKTNVTTRVIKRWSGSPWTGSGSEGTTYRVTYLLRSVQHSSYIRLRGTNLGLGVPGQTSASGNPLIDKKNSNSAARAWADCWFYSNPIFIRVAK